MKRCRVVAALHLMVMFSWVEFASISGFAEKIVINEIMFHPGVGEPGEAGYIAEDVRQEYIELLNLENKPVNLKDWQLTKGVTYRFPEISLPPGGFLVVAADPDSTHFKTSYQSRYPAVLNAIVLGGWTGHLNNHGEEIELTDSAGKRVDLVPYATEGDWALRRLGTPYPGQPDWWPGWQWLNLADAGGRSLELVSATRPNQYGQNWTASRSEGGTPGGPNSALIEASAPFLLDVRHRPAIPSSTKPVTVTARLEAQSAVASSVVLFSRRDGEPSFQAVPMLDDGLHGDGAAADGVFGAILPAQTNRTIVEFYIQASAAGQTRTWPGPSNDLGAQEANALYQVDDAGDGGEQPIYRLIFRQAEYETWLNLMDNVSNGRYSNASMHGTFVSVDGFGTEVHYSVTVRNRGAGTRAAHPHNLHVRFSNDRPWHGTTELDLNTRSVHAQVAGNALASLAGLENTLGGPVQVRVNGSNLAFAQPAGSMDTYQFGSYYAFEPYGTEWLKRYLSAEADANLYKATWYLDYVKLSNNGGDLRYLGPDPVLYRQAYGPTGPDSGTGAYTKLNNVSEDNWGDLIGLLGALNTSSETNYYDEVSRVIDINQWLRFFAVNSLLGNLETTLSTGVGDDYALLSSKRDGRFRLLPHDFDTALGQGDTAANYAMSIFKPADLPVLERFLKHPRIVPRYYAVLLQLAQTTFSSEKAAAVLEQVLGGWVSPNVIRDMKDFVARRSASVIAQIPQRLTITSPPADVVAKTPNATLPLGGQAPAVLTRSVLVNGHSASWEAWTGSWTAEATLNPGFNRIVVQALDETGVELERTSVDVWRDTGAVTSVPGGQLGLDTVWTAAAGPYLVTSNLIVPAGVTLTVEAGTTVAFAPAAALVVQGRLNVNGTATQRIRFTRQPDLSGPWAGIQFAGTRAENRIAYADLEQAEASGQSVSIEDSQVVLDHVVIPPQNATVLAMRRPRTVVRNCVFREGTAHSTMNIAELAPDGWLIVEGNLFGTVTGPTPVVQLHQAASASLAPVPQFRDNVFLGAESAILQIEGTDLHLEGNLFMRSGWGNASPRALAAVSLVSDGSAHSISPHLTSVRNIYWENDYGVLLETGAFAQLQNDVFVHNRGAVIFDEPARAEARPGRGCSAESCIFWENRAELEEQGSGTFVHLNNRSPQGHSELRVNNSILPVAYHSFGGGNLEVDPLFLRASLPLNVRASLPEFAVGFNGFAASTSLMQRGGLPDLRLQPGSPARQRGFNGTDLGAFVSTKASLGGLPESESALASAQITVAGTDIASYRYRLLGPGTLPGAWSDEVPVLQRVSSLIGRERIATATIPGHGYIEGDSVEIVGAEWGAYNGLFTIFGVTPDTFSYQTSNTPPDQVPAQDIWCRRFKPITLPNLPAGAYRLEVVRKNSVGVWQSADDPTVGSWTVSPSVQARVRLNEILAVHTRALSNSVGANLDAVELYNPNGQTADLSGLSLATSLANSRQFVFPPETRLGPGQFLLLWADNDRSTPGLHLGFGLNREGDALYLFDAPGRGGAILDSVIFGHQVSDYSIGRVPGGGWGLTVPTLGGPNRAALLGDPGRVVLNELLAAPRHLSLSAFVELYNPQALPVQVSGLFLTPEMSTRAGAGHKLEALSFIGPGDFLVLYPDGQPSLGPGHLEFRLDAAPGALNLSMLDGSPVDSVVFGPSAEDIAVGRSPDGTKAFVPLQQPTPAAWNARTRLEQGTSEGEVVELIGLSGLWSFNQNGVDLGVTWKEPGYDDSSWTTGPALFYAGANTFPGPTNTVLSLVTPSADRINTYYFRTHLLAPTNLVGAALEASLVADDGAAVYLNGQLVLKVGLPSDTPLTYSTKASRTVNSLAVEGPFSLPVTSLRPGDNVMAVEVHQVSESSHDVAFGLALRVTSTNSARPMGVAAIRLSEFTTSATGPGEEAALASPWIELENTSDQTVDLAGASLTDHLNDSRQWVFPMNSVLAPHGFMVVASDQAMTPSPANAGLQLTPDGGGLYLFAPAAEGGFLIDAVNYGLQAGGFSLGRAPGSGDWTLTQPTPGTANLAVPLGSVSDLRINEWMADPSSGPDWVELFNSGPEAVSIGGLFWSDDLNLPGVFPIPALSFIGTGAGAFRLFTADGDGRSGANHTDFKLSASGESIGLFDSDGLLLDGVHFGPQEPGVSEGRFPDGAAAVIRFPTNTTPGRSNAELRITRAVVTDQGFVLEFVAAAGRAYVLEARDTLGPTQWIKLAELAPQSSSGPQAFLDSVGSVEHHRFYRLRSTVSP